MAPSALKVGTLATRDAVQRVNHGKFSAAAGWSPLALRICRYGVFRVHDDGRRELMTPIGTHEQAAEAAGAMRDEMTDDECAEGWNYLPGKVGA